MAKKRLLLEVSEKFHADVKAKAAKKNKSIKELIIEAIVKYLFEN